MEVEPHDARERLRRANVNRYFSKQLREVTVQALERCLVEQQRGRAMGAGEKTAHHQPPLGHEEVATPQELCVRYVPVVIQPWILDPGDGNHRHMEVSAGKLGRLGVVAAMAVWTL